MAAYTCFRNATKLLPVFTTINVEDRGMKVITNFESLFTIQKELGSGAFGKVVLAQDMRKCRQVALKIIKFNLEYFNLIISEVEVMASLSGSIEGIPLFYEDFLAFYEDEVQIVISMEYIEGLSLMDVIEEAWEKRSYPDCDALTMFSYWLFNVLYELHRRDIVHRDIKPENILISKDKFYLVDYGFACSVTPKDNHTCVENIAGTVLYMPPEFLEQKFVTLDKYKAVDIWSAAVTISFLAGLGIRYQGDIDNMAEYLEFVKTGALLLDSQKCPVLSMIINECLTPEPELRPTALEVKNSIEKMITFQNTYGPIIS